MADKYTEASENEEEEFADASEGQENTRPASPIPMTRVEKVCIDHE